MSEPGAGVEAPHFDRAGVLAGARLALPIGLSVFGYGLVFGVLARGVGLGGGQATLMSAIVYSGTAQLIALDLWASPPPLGPLLLTTLIVSLRHLLMGLTLGPLLTPRTRTALIASAFWLADENWALLMGELARGRRNVGFLLGSGLVLNVAWVSATLVGWLAAGLAPDPARWGADFAFTAVFLALLTGLWRGRADLLPWLVAAAVALAARALLPGTWYILLGALAGSLVGAWRHGR